MYICVGGYFNCSLCERSCIYVLEVILTVPFVRSHVYMCWRLSILPLVFLSYNGAILKCPSFENFITNPKFLVFRMVLRIHCKNIHTNVDVLFHHIWRKKMFAPDFTYGFKCGLCFSFDNFCRWNKPFPVCRLLWRAINQRLHFFLFKTCLYTCSANILSCNNYIAIHYISTTCWDTWLSDALLLYDTILKLGHAVVGWICFYSDLFSFVLFQSLPYKINFKLFSQRRLQILCSKTIHIFNFTILYAFFLKKKTYLNNNLKTFPW